MKTRGVAQRPDRRAHNPEDVGSIPTPAIQQKHRGFDCKLEDGGTIRVQANSRLVFTDMLSEGVMEYDARENTFYRGTLKPSTSSDVTRA